MKNLLFIFSLIALLVSCQQSESDYYLKENHCLCSNENSPQLFDTLTTAITFNNQITFKDLPIKFTDSTNIFNSNHIIITEKGMYAFELNINCNSKSYLTIVNSNKFDFCLINDSTKMILHPGMNIIKSYFNECDSGDYIYISIDRELTLYKNSSLQILKSN